MKPKRKTKAGQRVAEASGKSRRGVKGEGSKAKPALKEASPMPKTAGSDEPPKAWRNYIDLKKVAEAMDALFALSRHLHCLEQFLLHWTRDKHSEEDIRRAFWRPIESWPGDHSMNPNWNPGTLEDRAKTAFYLIGNLPDAALRGLRGLYMNACDQSNYAAEAKSKAKTTAALEVEAKREAWLIKLAEWAADAFSEPSAVIAQEDAAWRKSGGKNKRHQTRNFLRACMVGEIAPSRENPFPKAWKRYRYDESLRAVSSIRDFVDETLSPHDCEVILSREACLKGFNLNPKARAGRWTAKQFEEAWPYLRKELQQAAREYNELIKLDAKTARNSFRWGKSFQECVERDGFDFEEWRSFCKSGRGWHGFGGVHFDWGKHITPCKKASAALLCRPDKPVIEWRNLFPPPDFSEDEPLFVPKPKLDAKPIRGAK